MSAEAVGKYMPSIITLDDLAAMISADTHDTAQTVTLHRLGSDGSYAVAAQIPLAWLLQTSPADHLAPPA